MNLGKEITRATWRRKLEALDPIDLTKALSITVPTQRHIPKSFQEPFRAILMELLIRPSSRAIGHHGSERRSSYFCSQMRAPSASTARTARAALTKSQQQGGIYDAALPEVSTRRVVRIA